MATVSPPTASPAVTTEEAAPIVGVSPATLKTWRNKGIGPPYVVVGTTRCATGSATSKRG